MTGSTSIAKSLLRAITLLALAATVGGAQESVPSQGRIIGRAIDAESGRPLPGTQVTIEGTALAVLAGLDGRYLLQRVPPGTVVVRASMIGFATKTVTGVVVPAGATVELNVSLDPSALLMDEIIVTAAAERGSVARALDEQRTAVNVVSALTSDEISRSPDGDAAEAVKRVSGVTVQDGRYVFVRGLGERYTTTSLNGARVPSPEPERRVVPLDLFPTGLLETITTAKTFTPDLPGDFSGAQVNIQTRTFPTRRQLTFSASTGYNSAATSRDILFAPGVGGEWLGLAARDRGLPSFVEQFGNFQTSAPSQPQVNQMVRSFRNAWSAGSQSGRPKSSFSASVGGSDPLFGRQLGYLLSGTYSYSEDAKIEQRRAQAQPTTGGATQEVDRFVGNTGGRSVLWGGLMNLSALVNPSSRILFNATYNRTADDEARVERGSSENLGQAFEIQRLRYVERVVASGQLEGEHQMGDAHRIDWSGTASRVTRTEPDRSEFVRQLDVDPSGNPLPPAWFSVSNEGAVRTFSDLSESSYEGSLAYAFSFGSSDAPSRLKLGTMSRYTTRDASNLAYAISGTLDQASRELSAEEIFDGRFAADTAQVFRITPVSQGGSYAARDGMIAGFAMLDWAFSPSLRMIAGARVEFSSVEVDAQSTLGQPVTTTPSDTDVLPSLSLNWTLSETQTVRLSASQTLSRPEYRELAPVQYRDVLGGDNVVGNPDLVRALIRNYDARWEWYPTSGEALSVGIFAKDFRNPIERVYLGTSGTRIVTFANAQSAWNYGVEAEARKHLGFVAEALESTSIFANVTLMRSEIELGQGLAERRPMVGQSPYVVNTGVSYLHQDTGVSATALYNIAGRRITSAAEAPLPSVYEQSRHGLDLSLRFPLMAGLRAKVDFENVFDSPYEQVQGTVVREYYRTGRTLVFGASWQPGA
ncbi:MAG: TonB-dependent receptor [Gemmatimonadetes bacterium]|nr:TonB-dependent receptor [Gemmatimonadota bacterium]